MITANIYSRVYHLKHNDGTGTCFAIDYENKQYIVTAKHVIEGLEDEENIELYFNYAWTKFKINLVGHHPEVDVSVMSLNSLIGEFPAEPTLSGIAYGQDVYFLGFPYMLSDKASSRINRNFPIALVKKAILSAMINDETGKYILLDGINNPGFSGGPVIFKGSRDTEFKIGAIISGYRYADEPIYRSEKSLDYNVRVNTGLIIAFDIKHAIDIIKKNPIGKLIT